MVQAPLVRRSELADALRACRGAFRGVGAMSCFINLLYLTGSIFMLEVYDRVLPSRSVPTLVGLIILASFLYIAQGVLDMIRGRILGRVGTALDESPQCTGVRNRGAIALDDRQPQRGTAAAARSRQCPFLSRRHGAERVLRSAVAAALSRDLFRLPCDDRPHCAGRRPHPGVANAGHRIYDAPARA